MVPAKVYFPTLLKSWLFTSTYMTVLGVTVDAACTSNAGSANNNPPTKRIKLKKVEIIPVFLLKK